MSEISADLLQAMGRLRKAAQTELTDNAYYLAANRIADLMEMLGAGDVNADVATNGHAASFDDALADLRIEAEKQLSGNIFYMMSNRLEDLVTLGSAVEIAPRRFDDLAEAARKRVDAVRASLGLPAQGRTQAPVPLKADRDILERRSSEPCAMAELDPDGAIPARPGAKSQAKSSVREERKESRKRKSLLGQWFDVIFGRKS